MEANFTGAAAEVVLEARAAEDEFKAEANAEVTVNNAKVFVMKASDTDEFKEEEANAEVTNNVTKATVMEANFTGVGANSVSISAAASDQVGLQIASEIIAATGAAAAAAMSVGTNNTFGSKKTVGINLSREALEAKLTDSTTAEHLSAAAAAEVAVEAVEVTVAEITGAKVTAADDLNVKAECSWDPEVAKGEAGFISGKAGADAKATATEVVGDGHVIGKVTFGQPSAWSSSLSESQPYAWLANLRGSITKATFTHVAWKEERTTERDRVRNVMPEQYLSEDLAIMNPVDPQQQQANDTNNVCQAWTHSWQAPLSNAGITPADKPQEQPSVDVAVDTTKAVFCLSGSFAGHMITQANSVGGVLNAGTEVMTVSQNLVDLNAVDPQQQQAGCVSWIYSWQAPLSNTCVTTSGALPDQPAVDVAVDTTKAASGLSASLSKHMITQANSFGCVFNAMTEVQLASCAAENATAINKANASTLRNYASGVAEALQSAPCTPAMTLDDVAIVHASGASPKAASNLSFSCAVNTNTVNAAQSTSCAATKAAAIDTVATTNKLVGIPTSNGGNNVHGTAPSAIQLQTTITVASLFSIPKGKVGTEWKVLMRKDAATLMKGAVAECNKGASAERNSISGAIIALLLHIPLETVQSNIGRWPSNTSIGYQRYKAELMGGIASKLINTH
jgi:hypothetical protein